MKNLILFFLLLGSLSLWSQPPATGGGGRSGGTTVLGQGGGTGQVVAYPNPATGLINVSLADCKAPLNIIGYAIYDGAGQPVISGETEAVKTIQVDLGQLESGNYFIQIFFDGIIESCSCNTAIEKFIKE